MDIRPLMREFSKSDLLNLAEDLDLLGDYNVGLRDLIKLLIDDIEINGIPEEDECSPLMDNFLLKAKFIDADGNVLERDDTEEVEEEIEEIVKPDSKQPQCWSMADARAPECRRCKVYDQCKVERDVLKPPCYGKLFDAKDKECQRCIENSYCRELVEKGVANG